MYRRIAIAVALGAIVAGCAPAGPQGALPAEDPVYSTGSHLPKRSGGGGSATVDASAPTPDQTVRPPIYVPATTNK
jgi:hypothetical protein